MDIRAFLQNLGRQVSKAKANVIRKLEERRKRKEEERRIYEEAYRKAYIKALKEKARKEARKKAFAPSFGELVLKMLFSSNTKKRKKAPVGPWGNPMMAGLIQKPNYDELFRNPWAKKKRGKFF